MRPWPLFALLLLACQQTSPPRAANGAAPAPSALPAEKTMSIDELAAALQKPPDQRPIVLHVGFHPLYEEGHIPGAIDLGAGATPEGQEALAKELRSIPPGRQVVIYCGCCPADHCPNVRPAMRVARQIRGDVVSLDIPHSFRNDWKKRGLPVATGTSP